VSDIDVVTRTAQTGELRRRTYHPVF